MLRSVNLRLFVRLLGGAHAASGFIRGPMSLRTRATTRAAWAARPGALLVAAMLTLAACHGSDPASVAQGDAAFQPTTILDAVLVGDRAAVERFITRGANVNAAEADGTTLLMRAIHGRFPEIARVLIASGAKVSVRNSYGVGPLYLAARGADVATVRELLAAGADANTALPEGEPVLMTAAKAGNVDVVRLLLAGVARNTPFARVADGAGTGGAASGYGSASIELAGPVNRADPNAKEGLYGQTALMWAAAEGHADVAQVLIEGGADLGSVDEQGSNAVMMAAIGRGPDAGVVAVMQLLLDGGVDVNAVNWLGDTALHRATLRGSTAVIQFLVDHGADVHARDGSGRIPLDIAMGVPEEQIPYNDATATLLQRLTQRQ